MPVSIRNTLAFLGAGLAIAACGGGGGSGSGSPPPPAATNFTVGGTVSGLSGAVVLQNNGGNDLTVNASGAFAFTTSVASGAGYSVTVRTQPSSPAQVCTVGNGAGTVSGGNVTTVAVACAATPLTLMSSVPASAATDVARGVVPTLVFSAALDPATVIPANFVLSAATGDQAVAVSVAGTQATITPSVGLQSMLAYSLTVSTAVRGAAGEQLAGPVTVTFTTRGGAWGTATLIESDDTGSAHNPETAIDDSGNALAVWDQFDGTRASIWSNGFTPANAWGTAGVRENDPGDAFMPHVAFDGSGNALAVWQQSDGTRYNIWSSRYTPAGGWQMPVLIENDPNNASDVELAVNANGDGFAVWTQSNTMRPVVWARRHVAGSGWGGATRVQTDQSGDGFFPQVAIDPVGNAVVVWHQTDGTRYNILANYYTVGSGWEAAVFVESDNAGDALYPKVGMDANGNALAVWQQHDGTRFGIMSNRLPSGGSWATPVPIESDDNAATLPQLAVNAAGEALVVWMQQQPAAPGQDVFANRYTSGSGWGTAVPLETDDGSAILPQVALNASGVGHAVWMQRDGTRFNIIASGFTPASGWDAPITIDGESGDAFNPSIAINASGTVQVIWRQNDGMRFNVWGSRFE